MRKTNSIACVALLLTQALIPAAAILAGAPQGELTGFVVPSEVHEKEPFTFAGEGVLEGEVITIQTVEGEVIAEKKADKHGRVFLAAGLAGGAYLLTHSGGKKQARLNVQPPRETPPGPDLKITNPPSAGSLKEGLSLQGEGLTPDAAGNVLTIGGKEVPILAATPREAKTGPLKNLAPGYQPVKLKRGDGQEAEVAKCLFYDLKASLQKVRIGNGERTTLEFTFLPKNVPVYVSARILSGPVSFEGGKKEIRTEVKNGTAQVRLVADPAGLGAFRVAFSFDSIKDEKR
jgi:hypothetical protein